MIKPSKEEKENSSILVLFQSREWRQMSKSKKATSSEQKGWVKDVALPKKLNINFNQEFKATVNTAF